MSIPVICRTATTQDAAARPSVAAKAAAGAAVRIGLGEGGGDLGGTGGVADAAPSTDSDALRMLMVFLGDGDCRSPELFCRRCSP